MCFLVFKVLASYAGANISKYARGEKAHKSSTFFSNVQIFSSFFAFFGIKKRNFPKYETSFFGKHTLVFGSLEHSLPIAPMYLGWCRSYPRGGIHLSNAGSDPSNKKKRNC